MDETAEIQPDDKLDKKLGDLIRIMRQAHARMVDLVKKDARSFAVLTGLVRFNEADDRPLGQRLSDGARNMATPDDKVQTLVRRQATGLSQTVGNMAIRIGLRAQAPGHVGDGFVLAPRPGYAPRDPAYVREAGAMKKDLKPLLDAAVGRFEKASDAEVVGILGSAQDRDRGTSLPGNGAARRNAIRAMALRAFGDERLGEESPHSPAFNKRTLNLMRHPDRVAEVFSGKDNVHDVNRKFASDAIDRTSYLMAGGKALDARIENETRAIMAAPDFHGEIADRFARSPRTDLREPPKDIEGRRDWVSGALRTEAAFLSKALIRGDDVLDIAAAVRGPVPSAAPEARIDTVRATGAALRIGKHDYEDARSLDRLPDAALRHRFRTIPGVETSEIDRNRTDWVARAISIERTRDVMRSTGISDHASRTLASPVQDKTIVASKDAMITSSRDRSGGPSADTRRLGISAQVAAAHRGISG